MGANQSNLIPMPDGFDYMAITFTATDRIRIIYPTYEEVTGIRETIMHHWPNGIQQEINVLASAHEFKLRGNPFCGHTSLQEAINLRKLCCQLLFRLYNLGCKLLISSDLAQTTDLATWIFHREQTQQAQFHFAAIGVSSTDKLQFVDFPASMHQMFRDVVQRNWPKNIQDVIAISDALEIKLSGNPWMSAGGSENVQSKTLVKALINELDAQRWVLYASSNLKGTTDTLFFRYDPNLPMDGSRRPAFAISLSGYDRLRLVDSPEDVVNCVKTMLIQFWAGGIQAENYHFNAYEFKLAGYPWWSDGTEAIYPRLLMCKIFEALMRIGWRVQMAIDLSRAVDDKSVLTFQAGPPIAAPIFCLSLNYTDRIRIINAPADTVEAITDEIRRLWLFGIQCEEENGPSMELKLQGNPWRYSYDGHDGAHGRVLLLHLLKLCASLGWFVIVSANVSAKYHVDRRDDHSTTKYPLDVHSWWFIRMGGQATAAPQIQAFSQQPEVLKVLQLLNIL
ncbi:uncharacterized protein LOC135686231 [Rhopilema esculentum]|uniref:uncharacterized protein LOC135686231 n=1 Tax=Rhopilema esculentum TaxID=499914 RepID=UPI0031DB3715|eukprot:gene169-9794_t